MSLQQSSYWLSVILLLLISQTVLSSDSEWHDRSLQINDKTFQYRIYVPEYSRSPTKPSKGNRFQSIILFLHGAGERGSDNVLQTTVGLGKYIKNNKNFPHIVVMPQCAEGMWWSDKTMELMAIAALDKTIREFKVDTKKVMLTGLSMGGYGALNMAVNYPDKFSHVVAMSGRLRPPKSIVPYPGTLAERYPDDSLVLELAERLCHIPLWLFHGRYDSVVPVSESKKLYQAMKERQCPVLFTEHSKGGHDIWEDAYGELWRSQWWSGQKVLG